MLASGDSKNREAAYEICWQLSTNHVIESNDVISQLCQKGQGPW